MLFILHPYKSLTLMLTKIAFVIKQPYVCREKSCGFVTWKNWQDTVIFHTHAGTHSQVSTDTESILGKLGYPDRYFLPVAMTGPVYLEQVPVTLFALYYSISHVPYNVMQCIYKQCISISFLGLPIQCFHYTFCQLVIRDLDSHTKNKY